MNCRLRERGGVLGSGSHPGAQETVATCAKQVEVPVCCRGYASRAALRVWRPAEPSARAGAAGRWRRRS
eukprot:3501268-Alexandrium_andersonii.AAC.1